MNKLTASINESIAKTDVIPRQTHLQYSIQSDLWKYSINALLQAQPTSNIVSVCFTTAVSNRLQHGAIWSKFQLKAKVYWISTTLCQTLSRSSRGTIQQLCSETTKLITQLPSTSHLQNSNEIPPVFGCLFSKCQFVLIISVLTGYDQTSSSQ